MPSIVWDWQPEEAYRAPYEYSAQEQFVREAKSVLQKLNEDFAVRNGSFGRDDQSVEKATWMLQVDSLEALHDALLLTIDKKHRIACRLFRDAVETQDMSFYFARAGKKAEKDLKDWYSNKVIPHRVARAFVQEYHGKERAEELRSFYEGLSKYTHRTYRALAMSYILGRDDMLFYDGFKKESSFLVVPNVISFSYAVLALLIHRFVEIAVITNQIAKGRASTIWAESLESSTVPRRFRVVFPASSRELCDYGTEG